MTTGGFDHFLLTRFNVRHETRASDEWLRHRLGYFERLCRSSIINQTNKNFRWLVYFDAERDEWFQREVDRLSAGGVFEPIWVEGPLDPQKTMAPVAERAISDWVITTRLDNDDAVAFDFIESIQSEYSGQDLEFINFQSGLQLSDDGGLYHRLDPSNAFISLIEKRREALTGVYIDWHDRVASHGPIRQVNSHPIWLQMVHGQNIGNAIRGVRAKPQLLERHFVVQAAAKPTSPTALRLSQARTAASLMFRVLQKPSRILWLGRVIRNRVLAVIGRLQITSRGKV